MILCLCVKLLLKSSEDHIFKDNILNIILKSFPWCFLKKMPIIVKKIILVRKQILWRLFWHMHGLKLTRGCGKSFYNYDWIAQNDAKNNTTLIGVDHMVFWHFTNFKANHASNYITMQKERDKSLYIWENCMVFWHTLK